MHQPLAQNGSTPLSKNDWLKLAETDNIFGDA